MTFNNNSSQAERKQFVKGTFHSRTRDEAGGRFAQVNKSTVVGSDPATLYPRIKSGPWSDQPGPGPEPPYGEDISTPPIVGESWEVEASLDENMGVQRALRDGAPPETGPPVSRSSELAPDTEVIRANSDEEPARHSPAVSEDGAAPSFQSGRGRPAPSSTNIKRRLV